MVYFIPGLYWFNERGQTELTVGNAVKEIKTQTGYRHFLLDFSACFLRTRAANMDSSL
jgi:hypothetical protein